MTADESTPEINPIDMPDGGPSSYHLLSVIGEAIDEAIETVAPLERLCWDTGYIAIPTPQGIQVQPTFMLYMPNPVPGHGSLMASAAVPSLRELGEPSQALSLVRDAVAQLRQARSNVLGEPGAASLIIPGR